MYAPHNAAYVPPVTSGGRQNYDPITHEIKQKLKKFMETDEQRLSTRRQSSTTSRNYVIMLPINETSSKTNFR